MKRFDLLVTSQDELDLVTSTIKDGWVPDPVLMPTGRPNVVEGVGAVYHLVFAELEGGADVQLYMQRSRFAEPEFVKAPEFAGVLGTVDLPHGQLPEEFPDMVWSIHAVYQKNVIWVRRAQAKEVS